MLKQTMPALENLIENAGNFNIALDLIHNANEMIDSKLKNVKVCAGFKKQLEDFKFRCTSKLESECLNLVDSWVNSRL